MSSLKRVTEIPGPKSRELFAREAAHLAPGLQGFAQLAGVVMESGSGSRMRDVDGNEFIDFIGGIGVNGLGHSHPRYVKAIQEQVAKLSVGSFSSIPRLELVEKVAKLAPGRLDQLQLYSGGAEAVESALRLAKCHTGKWEFVGFWGGFHGKTLGAMGLLGDGQKNAYGPFAPGSHLSPFPDFYRCPFGTKTPEASRDACLDHLRKLMKKNTAGAVAAIIIEPCQGTAGNIIPPPGWWKGVREIADEFECLLIADEMITGFGRTGEWFASAEEGVEPDIITLGKSFAGGFPASGVVTSRDIAQALPWAKPSGSSSSYGGNALAAVAALTAIEIIEEEVLLENSRKRGEELLARLRKMQERFEFIGEVRGKGLFVGIELVKDRKTKEPLSIEIMEQFYRRSVDHGLLAMSYKPTIRIQPALNIDAETLASGCDLFELLFQYLNEEMKLR